MTARLDWHRAAHNERKDYFLRRNRAEMQEWLTSWAGMDRYSPEGCREAAASMFERGMTMLAAAKTLVDAERRKGAMLRAGRLLRRSQALDLRAAALERNEAPLDEWEVCRCGGAYQPGPRGYTQCYQCSSAEYWQSSLSCVFCAKRHSMSFKACFDCSSRGLEDRAAALRLMVTVRDRFTCALCGIDGSEDGASLQIDHILPISQGGTSDPWNLQVVCGTCQGYKQDRFGPLDEIEFWRQVQMYIGGLGEYLAADEMRRLLALRPDVGREISTTRIPVPWADHGVCGEQEGILNIMAEFEVQVEAPETKRRIEGTDPCKGEVILSDGTLPCTNKTDYAWGILCEGPCR